MVRNLFIVLAASVTVVTAIAACGPSVPESAGKTCAEDAECGEKALCHPTAKLCVQSCAKSDECGGKANTCAALNVFSVDGGSAAGPMACTCTDDSQCGDGKVCSTLDQICVPACSDEGSCQGRACDTATGKCRLKHCGESPSLCSDTQYCDTTNNCLEQKCDPDAGFLGADGGPSSCGYGQYCPAKTGCAPVPQGGCSLVTSAPAWDAGARGPVIVSATAQRITPSVSTECGTPSSILLTVKYYQAGGLTQTLKDSTTIGENVKYDEGQGIRSAAFTRSPPAVGAAGAVGEFTVGYCPVSTVNTHVGLHLADDTATVRKTGNAVCVPLP